MTLITQNDIVANPETLVYSQRALRWVYYTTRAAHAHHHLYNIRTAERVYNNNTECNDMYLYTI